ncbi:DUF4134 domain-containing protein [Pedobacter sp. ISL-68]|uniref:DUF4134 family protein n=1 Tax=unclassified Pedobacter TaxID=2628915 RepID=UPI001BE86B92|nr:MULTISPECIES: DUF4134 family protein [unclassified Pedobacter]MBT2560120.1 DUF4134 domain-containing protein [Pedobacter sp. ISL-64]MBT2589099.1 DUF4134 domain-containing protein [Pedobacter sp. ISL-68]
MKNRCLFTWGILTGTCGTALAQPGLNEMQQARQELTGSFFSSIDASLVLAVIFGLIGALKIYHNWQMGKERITGDVAAWFFASLFMVLAGPFVRAIFGI